MVVLIVLYSITTSSSKLLRAVVAIIVGEIKCLTLIT